MTAGALKFQASRISPRWHVYVPIPWRNAIRSFGSGWAARRSRNPPCAAGHEWHDDPLYQFTGDVYHYKAPYQLIHDNLLDLSHLGYVHTRTIGGNAQIHVQAEMTIQNGPNWVRVVRHMRDSQAPPTYSEAWPFAGRIDRWQEIEFHISYFLIWTGDMDVGAGDLEIPHAPGFICEASGITPETESTSFYFWTISSNRSPVRPDTAAKIHRATAVTFDEDRDVIEAQHANMARFPGAPMTGIHVDTALNRARQIIARLTSPAPVS